MTSVNLSNLASDALHIFEKTLLFFQNIGIVQSYSFSHSDVLFNPNAEKYLQNFISLLEEIRDILDKLQALHEQSKSEQVSSQPDVPNNTVMGHGDLISASHFIQTSEMFVSEHLIVAHDELGSFMAPTGLMGNQFNTSEIIIQPPEIIIEPGTQSSWTPAEEKDDDQEAEKVDEPSPGVTEKFQCSVCNKVLSSKSCLTHHEATHTGQKLFCCEHCGKLFTTSSNLAAHLTRQHNLNTESAHSCSKCADSPVSEECGKLFVRKSALDTHLKCHLGVKPFACDYCSKTFTQKVTRDTHQLTHTQDYRYCCGSCDKRFPTQAKLNYHYKTHGEPQFTCHLCDKKFATKQYLNAHYSTHDVRPPETAHCRLDTVSSQMVENASFSCSQCGRNFTTQHLLNLHTQKHNPLSARYRYLEKRKLAPRQKHPCELCGKEFLLKTSLAHHHRQKHATGLSERQKRPYSCHLCHKTFTLQSKARLHMQIHTHEAQHMCTVCGRLFRRKDSLRRHSAVHVGVGAPRLCGTCGVVSADQAAYREHAKTHATHYKCGQCEKTFRSRSALLFHIQSHEGNFKHQCAICGKQFVRKCHLRGHMLSHSTERPHKCDTCGKGFKDVKTCREHVKRVHANPPAPQVSTGEQLSTNQITANGMTSGQLAIHTLLAGDDATYGQTYDQFQACVQLQ